MMMLNGNEKRKSKPPVPRSIEFFIFGIAISLIAMMGLFGDIIFEMF